MFVQIQTIIKSLNLNELSHDKVAALKLIFLKLIKENKIEAAFELVEYLCDKDIGYTVKLLEYCNNTDLIDYLKKYICKEHAKLICLNVPFELIKAIIVLRIEECYQFAFDKISSNLSYYYKKGSNDGFSVSIHAFLLKMIKDDLLLNYLEKLFKENFSVYNPLYKEQFLYVLDYLDENMHYDPLNKIIQVVGIQEMVTILDESFVLELIRRIIITENASLSTWHSYIDYFSKKEMSFEEELINVIWFIPIYADNNPDPYIYQIWNIYDEVERRNLYINNWEIPKDISKVSIETRRMIRDVIGKKLAGNELNIVRFLRDNSYINPFWWNNISNSSDDQLIKWYDYIKTTEQNFASYQKLRALFQSKMALSTIVEIYLYTYIGMEVVIEDLVSLVREFSLEQEWTSVFSKRELWGYLKRIDGIDATIIPLSYKCIKYHHIQLSENSYLLKNIVVDKKSYYGFTFEKKSNTNHDKCIRYKINRIEKSHIIASIVEPESPISKYSVHDKWNSCLELLSSSLREEDPIKAIEKNKHSLLIMSDFSATEFCKTVDLSPFFQLILCTPVTLAVCKAILKIMLWNKAFSNYQGIRGTLKPEFIPLLNDYRKYEEDLYRVVLRIMHQDDTYQGDETKKTKKTLELYFTSIFKVIMPLDHFIAIIGNKPIIYDFLNNVDFICRKWERVGNSIFKCRLLNCCCSPICLLYLDEDYQQYYSEGYTIDAHLHDIVWNGNSIKEIFFEQTVKAKKVRYKDIKYPFHIIRKYDNNNFGNIRFFPDATTFINHNPDFFIESFMEGVFNRRTSIKKMKKLISIFSTGNPFKYNCFGEIGIYYYSESNDHYSEIILQNMFLNSVGVGDIIYVFLNSQLKMHLSLDSLYSIIIGKQKKNKERFITELTEYEFSGIVSGNYLYNIYFNKKFSVEIEDGLYYFQVYADDSDELNIIINSSKIDEKDKHILLWRILNESLCVGMVSKEVFDILSELCIGTAETFFDYFELERFANDKSVIAKVYKAIERTGE